MVDDSRPLLPADFAEQLAELIAAGRRGDAVELYQRVAVGILEEVVARMRQAPFRPGLEAIAHTLVYDATVIGDLALPPGLAASVTVPVVIEFLEPRPGEEPSCPCPDARGHGLAGSAARRLSCRPRRTLCRAG